MKWRDVAVGQVAWWAGRRFRRTHEALETSLLRDMVQVEYVDGTQAREINGVKIDSVPPGTPGLIDAEDDAEP